MHDYSYRNEIQRVNSIIQGKNQESDIIWKRGISEHKPEFITPQKPEKKGNGEKSSLDYRRARIHIFRKVSEYIVKERQSLGTNFVNDICQVLVNFYRYQHAQIVLLDNTGLVVKMGWHVSRALFGQLCEIDTVILTSQLTYGDTVYGFLIITISKQYSNQMKDEINFIREFSDYLGLGLFSIEYHQLEEEKLHQSWREELSNSTLHSSICSADR